MAVKTPTIRDVAVEAGVSAIVEALFVQNEGGRTGVEVDAHHRDVESGSIADRAAALDGLLRRVGPLLGTGAHLADMSPGCD